MPSDPDLHFGPFRLDASSGQLLRGTEAIPLQPKVMQALELFLAHPGELLPRETLDEALWPGVVVVDGALFQIVRKLRKALRDRPSAPAFVQTVPRRGYRWIAAVERATSAAPPAPASDIVGRDADLAAVRGLLAPGALVTLVGLGGLGKTTLARQVLAGHDGPTGFVDLTTARALPDVVSVTATALGLDPTWVRGDPDQLAEAVAAREGLCLVLDNAEGAVDAVGAWVTRLQQTETPPALLVTSRVPLGLTGERLHELGPLADDAALALLSTRARRSLHDDDDARALVRRLDGIPLALELAAARLALLSPGQLLTRLDHDRSLLRTRHTDTPARHASIDQVLRTTWDALPEEGRAAWARCTVFRGGFEVDDAEAVLGADALFTLEALHEAGLVRRHDSGRLGLYEVVREFGAEQLARIDPDGHATRAHVKRFDALGSHFARDHLTGDPRGTRHLLREVDNLQAAWTASHHQAVGAAFGLLAVSGRGAPHAQLEALADAAHDAARDDHELCVALLFQAVGEGRVGQWERAVSLADAAQRIAVELDDRHIAVRCADQHGRALINLGRWAEADVLFERLHDEATQLGDRRLELTVVRSWAQLDQQLGRFDPAVARLRHAMSLASQLGHPALASLLLNLAEILLHRGDDVEASHLMDQAQAAAQQAGDQRQLCQVLMCRGGHAWDLGDNAAAEEVTRRALALARQLGTSGDLPILLTQLGEILVSEGRLQEGRAYLEAALREGERQGRAVSLVFGRIRLALAAVLADEPADAWGHANALPELPGVTAGYAAALRATLSIAEQRDPQGHLDAARAQMPVSHRTGHQLIELLEARAARRPPPAPVQRLLERAGWLRFYDAAATHGPGA